MRHLGIARRAGALTAVTAAAVLSTAGPAAADVTVSPASVPQGSGQNLTFKVTNEGAAPITEVTLRIPADTPIAEVYPLSVDDWAPKIVWQKLSQPLTSIHNGTPVDEAPSAITWIAVGGTSIAPGGSADLTVAVGPLPTLSSVRFAVDAKLADGSAAPAMPPASLTLTPSDGTAATTHHGAAPTTGTDQALTPQEQAAFNEILEEQNGPSVMSIAGWVVAALALLGCGWVMFRNRHRAEEEPDAPSEPDENELDAEAGKEPVGAGTSKWAFKG
ncbi:hypothetical protein FB565_003571 [Actinoplanes lutulentus]|uniref:Uncharacterized protein DUF1775 n=1 Tax=Actinoplanes lutulentus TaxID=1287878 RepID=A0A327Z341_9ACTN|nr:DUF1775 domain-containing protein [Actinoplanes lutulentus]MBB2943842.1 hypothetical protein [Actinoplanes lutulentus]RAK29383.1 uncharacterized protein DUF1775 [Actinoplanes lutulentus]